MALFDFIRSALGLKSSDDGSGTASAGDDSAGTDVSIEHEPDTPDGEPEPATGSEAAVKGVDPGDGEADDEAHEGDATVDEPVAAGTDADGSTASIRGEPPDAPGADADEVAAEPAEAAGDDPVDSVSGIGQAYATRLGDAGVETVGDLLDADAAALAEETGISEKRITRWIETAEGDD